MKSFQTLYLLAKNRIISDIYACRDLRTNRKIIVLESDDWGSIRMSHRKDWEALLRLGYAVDKRPYERFDTLESPDDLEALFEVLSKHKDYKGNHPVITANMLMVNPDFEAIEREGFSNYYYEPISKTYDRYFGNIKVLDLMKQGLDEGVFVPQSHGREHFNVAQWMKGLQSGDEDLLVAFQHGMCGIAPKAHPEQGNQMMSALLAQNEEEQVNIDSIVSEGLTLFVKLWGFKSETFVAPRYQWNDRIERVLANHGVKLIQTARASKPAYLTPGRHYYTGQKNLIGQLYTVRNCHFEPSTQQGGATAEELMRQVDNTFSRRKIAIISTHRINYVGGIDEENRKRSLHILDVFLKEILKKYPDVEFKSSVNLIDYL